MIKNLDENSACKLPYGEPANSNQTCSKCLQVSTGTYKSIQ